MIAETTFERRSVDGALIPGTTLLVYEAEEGGFWGEVHGLPGCVSQGETVDELRVNLLEAMEAVLPHSHAEYPTTIFADSSQNDLMTVGTA